MLSLTGNKSYSLGKKGEGTIGILKIGNLEAYTKFVALSGYQVLETAPGKYKLTHPYRVSESYIELTDGKWLGYKIPKKLHR